MKNFKRTIIITSIVICVIALAIFGGFLGAGSYSYAQRYDFNTSKEKLIDAVKNFKNQNPQYKVPVNLDLNDSPDSTNNYYHSYIYYPSNNETIHFVIFNDPDNPNRSSIYLDAVNEGQYLGHWKVINRDYDRRENLEVKKMFESLLTKLKFSYKDNGNGMFIFWK